MGSVKSIRMNDKTEKMFNIIKSYYVEVGQKISDTEIISGSIELKFEQISEEMNQEFRYSMKRQLKKAEIELANSVFDELYNLLEVLCVANGSIIKQEFWSFLMVNVECNSLFEIDKDTEEKQYKNRQYEKIYDIIYSGIKQIKVLEKAIECIYDAFFNLYGKEYADVTE